ncbi:MAG: leucyl/phenylalanyl-tRNA--protein transferase [Ignavibacteriaceae bacterium]|nr:leucyl/phenylalanyl-tRNA--protein transferase [Ignavibacteriaceae bacterium]
MTEKNNFVNFNIVDYMVELYSQGFFPMADSKADPSFGWYYPKERAIINLDNFNIPRSLKQFINNTNFTVKLNHDFESVIKGCASRPETWISETLIRIYRVLFHEEYLKTLEIYYDGKLAGGLYGIQIGGSFIGESMFTILPQGSKIALVMLHQILVENGFILLDVQMMTPHLKMFGAEIIDDNLYKPLLSEAIKLKRDFTLPSGF